MNTENDGSKRKVLPCPRCGEAVDWNRNPRWKPFCSERCKMIDLGAWFSGEHAIPGEPVSDNNNDDEQSSSDAGKD